ncbi:MAG: Rossmann-like and DUF2520 domain-containing protein [Clostridia bacterium]
MKIGIIGAGRVGVSFGRLLYEKNLLSGFYSDVYPTFDYPVFETAEMLCNASDIIFITVPDKAINTVWNEIKGYCENKTVCHMSGAMSAYDAFGDKKEAASLHPMMAVSSINSTEELKTAIFTVEGGKADAIIDMFPFLDIRKINSDKKKLYHASCVFASNLLQAVLQISIDNLTKCGFNKDEGLKAIEKLTTTNVLNIFDKGIKESLTGPVDRFDTETVKKHLSVLTGEDREIYKLLTKKLTYIAEEKYNKDYSFFRKELE